MTYAYVERTPKGFRACAVAFGKLIRSECGYASHARALRAADALLKQVTSE